MKGSSRATEAETAILDVLWRLGPSTVRQVHDALSARATGYTTVLKLMQIMFQKELVARDVSVRSHIYAAQVTRERLQKTALHDLKERIFGGSMTQLVVRALHEQPASESELAEIQALVDRLRDQRAEPSPGEGQ